MITDATSHGHELTESVAQLTPIAPENLSKMRQEVLVAMELGILATNYRDWQNGSWKLLSLLNSSGDPSDTTVRETEAVRPTEVLEKMPAVRQTLEDIFPPNSVTLARLAIMEPGGRLWEHSDYTELDPEGPRRVRYHIPIQTDERAVIVTQGYEIFMREGSLWMLDPKLPHGVHHDGVVDRVHILIDAQSNSKAYKGYLEEKNLSPLEQMDRFHVEDCIESIVNMIKKGNHKGAESFGLNLFFQYILPDGLTTYTIIAEAYRRTGDNEQHRVWTEKNAKYLGGAN